MSQNKINKHLSESNNRVEAVLCLEKENQEGGIKLRALHMLVLYLNYFPSPGIIDENRNSISDSGIEYEQITFFIASKFLGVINGK